MKLLVATNNPGKLTEIHSTLKELEYEVLTPQQAGVSELDPEETGTTFAENAELKARAFGKASGFLALADDSGLEVSALDGQPGVKSKRFFPGSDADRNQHLLSLLQDATTRDAAFVTVMCLYDPVKDESVFFEGRLTGSIALKERGSQGFGYDPVFIPDGHTQTLAELGTQVKMTMSHRARALAKVKEYLSTRK